MPKSSADASRDPSCDLHTALMSVPSAPSGQIPEKEEKHSSKVLFDSKMATSMLHTSKVLKPTFYQPTESVKAESAGGSGPLHVTHRVHVGHMFTTGCLP